MKIALVILHADASRGGAEHYTVDLAAALAKRGHAVSLLACAFADEIAGVRNVHLDSPGVTRTRRYRQFLDALDHEIAGGQYDVVHAMLPVRRCDVYHPHAGMAVEQMGKWNHLFNPRRVAMATVERDLLLGEDPPITIALSEYVKRSILQSYPLPENRLATLFNAVDLERFNPAGMETTRAPMREKLALASGDVAALMIAQDFARKGLRTAIEALPRTGGEQPILFVAGKGRISPYMNLAKRLGVAMRLEAVGVLKDPRPLYAAADFFVLPTKHDPCSLVVLEALAMGLPVISTVFNGATEIMTDGVHGFVLKDPADADALADAMRKLLDPDTRAAMHQACLALRPKLSYEHHLDQLLNIYQSAMQRR